MARVRRETEYRLVPISLRIEPLIKDKLEKLAKRRKRPMGEVVREIFRDYLFNELFK